MAQHADKLTEGTKALLKKYPSFRVDVYPTHRSVAFPKFVLDNTAKNATTAKTTNGGRSIEGAHAGFPFPIPKDGYEAMWNHLVRFNGQAYEAKYRNLNVDASGRATLATEGVSIQEYPYWDNSKTERRRPTGASSSTLHRPGAPRRRGAADRRPARHRHQGPPRLELPARPAPRQGGAGLRLRHAEPGHRGRDTFDDTFIFNGSMDRFDFKLVGKKEMYRAVQRLQGVYQRQAGRPVQAEPPEPRPACAGNCTACGWSRPRSSRASATSTASAPSTSTRTAGRRWLATSTTPAASCTAPASPT